MQIYIKEKEKINKVKSSGRKADGGFFLFCFCRQGRHIQLGAALIEYSYASSNKNRGAYSTETHGMKRSGAAEVDNNACGDPDNVTAGFNFGKRKLVYGTDCAHKGVGSGEHQVCANDQNNAQSGNNNAGNKQNNAKPKIRNAEVYDKHAKVNKIAESDCQWKSENNSQGRLTINNYLSDDAKDMKRDGNISKGEWGNAANGVGDGTYGRYAEIKTLNKNKANSHKNEAKQILRYSAFQIHVNLVSFQ